MFTEAIPPAPSCDSHLQLVQWARETLGCVQQAIVLLEQKLPKEICYHNAAHTLDVMREAALFGLEDRIDAREMTLLLVAAAWHDVGFIESRRGHEESSARLFQGYCHFPDMTARTLILQAISDTQLVQSSRRLGSEQIARTFLSRYLLDADLGNLGREDFFQCLSLLEREHGAEPRDFRIAALGLITRHRWHTPAARALRSAQEAKNALALVESLKGQEGGGCRGF